LKDLKNYAAEFLDNADQAGLIAKAEELVKGLSAKSSEYVGRRVRDGMRKYNENKNIFILCVYIIIFFLLHSFL
jgi:hypothetical protein